MLKTWQDTHVNFSALGDYAVSLVQRFPNREPPRGALLVLGGGGELFVRGTYLF
jgi:hypothetical protein